MERPVMVLPAPFHTPLVPPSCTPGPGLPGTSPQILALPLRGGQTWDWAQLVMDSSCCPVLIGTNLILGERKRNIYIRTGTGTPGDWEVKDIRLQVNIEDTYSGDPVKGLYAI